MKTYPNAALQTQLLPCPFWNFCSYVVIRKFKMWGEGAASYRINQEYIKEPSITERLLEFG